MDYKSVMERDLSQANKNKAQQELFKYQDEQTWEQIGYVCLSCSMSRLPEIYKNKINGKFYVDKSKEIDLPKYNGEKNITVNKCDCGQYQIVACNNYRQDIYFSNK